MKTLPPHSTALLTCCNFVNLSVSISVIRKIRRKVHTAGPRGWEWWIPLSFPEVMDRKTDEV